MLPRPVGLLVGSWVRVRVRVRVSPTGVGIPLYPWQHLDRTVWAA